MGASVCLAGLLVDGCGQLFVEPNSIEGLELEGPYDGFC